MTQTKRIQAKTVNDKSNKIKDIVTGDSLLNGINEKGLLKNHDVKINLNRNIFFWQIHTLDSVYQLLCTFCEI